MDRLIEKLLRVVADMQDFEEGTDNKNKQVIEFAPDELTDEELDMVAAASQEYYIAKFDKKE